MSKKNILSEAVVRKFMKLAELENLSADFVSEQFKEEEVVEEATEEVVDEAHCGKRDDEDLEEGHGMEEGPGMAYKAHEDEEESAEEEAEEAEEEAGEELEAEEDLEMEEPAEEAEMSISPEEAEVLKSILQKLESAMGEEAAEAPEMDLDAEPEMEEEPMMEGDKEEKDDSLQEMVDTIAARVAKRILEQGK
tara:strand:+ start:780 stop:1358 length:579 start_codon:yes stop_codon:yes gene_type:complete